MELLRLTALVDRRLVLAEVGNDLINYPSFANTNKHWCPLDRAG